jgi:hypothetical protein
MERGKRVFRGPEAFVPNLLTLASAAVVSLSLIGCSGGSVVQALASMDAPEIEKHGSTLGKPPKRGEPTAPSLLSWSQYSSYSRNSEHPRLEMAALVSTEGPELLSAQVTPYLDSRLKLSDIALASKSESGVLLRAKAPAKILSINLASKNGPSHSQTFGPEGKAVAHLKSPIRTGDSGRMKVTLLQPSFSSASVVLVSPGRTDSVPRFRLTKLSEKGGRTTLLFDGKLESTDCPKELQSRTGFGRKLPLKVEEIGSEGVTFSMATIDFKKAWIVVLPELKLETLELPLSPGKLQPVAMPKPEKSASPLVRVIHEDPNKVAG